MAAKIQKILAEYQVLDDRDVCPQQENPLWGILLPLFSIDTQKQQKRQTQGCATNANGFRAAKTMVDTNAWCAMRWACAAIITAKARSVSDVVDSVRLPWLREVKTALSAAMPANTTETLATIATASCASGGALIKTDTPKMEPATCAATLSTIPGMQTTPASCVWWIDRARCVEVAPVFQSVTAAPQTFFAERMPCARNA